MNIDRFLTADRTKIAVWPGKKNRSARAPCLAFIAQAFEPGRRVRSRFLAQISTAKESSANSC